MGWHRHGATWMERPFPSIHGTEKCMHEPTRGLEGGREDHRGVGVVVVAVLCFLVLFL